MNEYFQALPAHLPASLQATVPPPLLSPEVRSYFHSEQMSQNIQRIAKLEQGAEI